MKTSILTSELRYAVLYDNRVESYTIAAFDNVNDARAWVDSRVKDEQECCETDTVNGNNYHWYTVLDISTADEDNPLGDYVYSTAHYYN